jgi:3-methyladenine DNA glycosylase/8-oxoguanine DNA glycosylase
VRAWKAELELVGPGDEPVDLRRTLASHGVADLPPNEIDAEAATLTTTLALPQGATTVHVGEGSAGSVRVTGRGPRAGVVDTIRHMLRLDDDLSAFYVLARKDSDLTWAAEGSGRMMRSPTVFEDVVKTICTTNCAWSATVRMTTVLVDRLGEEAPGGRRSFPTPSAMADADDAFYRDVVRAGYRGAYLRSLAGSVADGILDLEALNNPELADEEVAERLIALPGCGPYATAHMMMLLGRYSRLILDSWTRPTYARLNGRTATDKTIERRFRRYREYAGLAFWLYLTRDWI